MRAVHAPTPQVLENSIYIFNMVALDAFYVGHDGHLCVLTRSRLLKGHMYTESSNEVRPCCTVGQSCHPRSTIACR